MNTNFKTALFGGFDREDVFRCLKTGLEADVNVVPYEALEDLRQLQNLRMTARGGRLIWSHMKAMERIRFCVAAPGCE